MQVIAFVFAIISISILNKVLTHHQVVPATSPVVLKAELFKGDLDLLASGHADLVGLVLNKQICVNLTFKVQHLVD